MQESVQYYVDAQASYSDPIETKQMIDYEIECVLRMGFIFTRGDT